MRISLGNIPLILAFAATSLCLTACHHKHASAPIVGTWIVKIPEAPFHDHMMTFHADGTMLQANPDAGDPYTSDSNGLGAWTADGKRIKGKFVEFTADRTTRLVDSRGEITFDLTVDGNTFTGSGNATFFDAQGKAIRGPIAATYKGERVSP
jgi:hypothetical protein